MPDLEERFHSLGRVHPPDLWAHIVHREPRPAHDAWPGRRIVAAGLALAVAAAAIAFAAVAFFGHGERLRPAGLPVEGFGIRLSFPSGWDARISFVKGTPGPTVHGATFPLPPPGIGALFEAARFMGPEDVVLSLREFTGACPCTGFEHTSLPVSIRPEDFSFPEPSFSERGIEADQAVAGRAFEVDGRSFVVWVEFGSTPAPVGLNDQVNRLLASLELRASAGLPTEAPSDAWSPPTFEPAVGWQMVSTGPAPVGPGPNPLTWAANVPFHVRDLQDAAFLDWLTFTPRGTLENLPPDGVVIVTDLPLPDEAPASPNENFPARELPLQLSDAELREHLEGQAAPSPEYLILGTVKEQYVEVRVYFGTQDPSPALLLAAQEELNGLVVPDLDSQPAPMGKVTATIPVTDRDVGWVGDIAIAEQGGVWATVVGQQDPLSTSFVVRLDPQTNEVTASIPIEGDPAGIAATPDAVWVTVHGTPDAILRIDPAANAVVATVPLGSDHFAGPVAADASAVWVVDGLFEGEQPVLSLVRIDPVTNEVLARIPLPESSDFDDIAVGEGAVWLTQVNGGNVVQIDPVTDQVVATIPAGVTSNRFDGLAIGEGSVWVDALRPDVA